MQIIKNVVKFRFNRNLTKFTPKFFSGILVSALLSLVLVTSAYANGLSTWHLTTSLPQSKGDLGIVTLGNHIYALGGYCDECSPQFSNTVERANLNPNGSINSWQEETPMLENRSAVQAISYNNTIYAISGEGLNGSVPGSVEKVAVNPDGSLENWEATTSMTEARNGFATVVSNNFIYAIGGITTPAEGNGEFRDNVERATINPDGTIESWEILGPAMHTARVHSAAVVSGNYIYVFGGPIDTNFTNSVERAEINNDGTLGSWELMSSMVRDRYGEAGVTDGNYVYALGGTTDTGNSNTVERAQINPDGTLGAWQLDSSMQQIRFGFGAVYLNNNIYAVAGKNAGGNTLSSTEYTSTVQAQQIFSIDPAQVWIGLKNSDDLGVKFDLLAEAYKDSTLISSGQINSVSGGSNGFNNANLQTIPFNSFSPVDFPSGSALSVKVYVRNACTGSGHNSGIARLWYNDNAANSRFGATIDASSNTYYLLNNLILSSSVGTGPKKTVDVQSGAKCSPFKPFGTWTITP